MKTIKVILPKVTEVTKTQVIEMLSGKDRPIGIGELAQMIKEEKIKSTEEIEFIKTKKEYNGRKTKEIKNI